MYPRCRRHMAVGMYMVLCQNLSQPEKARSYSMRVSAQGTRSDKEVRDQSEKGKTPSSTVS